MKRRWKVMLWACREIPACDPQFEAIGGEEGEDSITQVRYECVLSGMDVLFMASIFVLGFMHALKPIFYYVSYWRML